MRFDYREYDPAGNKLDSEIGGIGGVNFKLGQHLSKWQWDAALSMHHGQVAYNGQTNFGNPLSTRTDEKVWDGALRLGYWFENSLSFMPYAGIGYRRWDRDIQPSPGVGGLFESYRWNYLWLGSRFQTRTDGTSRYSLDIGLLKPLRPQMSYDTGSVYAVLHPSGNPGLRVLLGMETSLNRDSKVTIEPYYEYWSLGRSPAVSVGPIQIIEPDSKTNNVGINLRVDWSL